MEQNENWEQTEPLPIEETPMPVTKNSIVKPILKLACGIAVALAFAFVIFSCASRLEAQEKRTEQLLSQLRQQILELQEELNSKSFTGNGNSLSGTGNVGQDGGMTPAQVYAKTVNSVVAITNEIRLNTGNQAATASSSGSGFILTEDGFIVTNYHVVEGAARLTVTLHNGIQYPVQLRGYDAANDLAVLKIEADGLPTVTLGSSKELIVGDQVAVIGNPLSDLSSTLTVGYISAKDRVISTDGSLIKLERRGININIERCTERIDTYLLIISNSLHV